MANCLLKTFCCCGTLRTGTIITGICGIILAILGIILTFTANLDLQTLIIELPKPIVQIIITINLIMTIIISILLIIGTVKRNMYFMIPWIALGFMLSIGLLVTVIRTSVNFFMDGDNISGSLFLVFGIIAIVVYLYFWWVAFSFFYIIKEETVRGAYIKDPFRRHPSQ